MFSSELELGFTTAKHSHLEQITICDWISENPAPMHNYKYLEIPILII